MRDDGVWVHPNCMLPVKPVCELNLFRFGPLHNQLVTVRDLWKERDKGYEKVKEYTWTQEIVYGSESGRPARVWVHRDASEM